MKLQLGHPDVWDPVEALHTCWCWKKLVLGTEGSFFAHSALGNIQDRAPLAARLLPSYPAVSNLGRAAGFGVRRRAFLGWPSV